MTLRVFCHQFRVSMAKAGICRVRSLSTLSMEHEADCSRNEDGRLKIAQKGSPTFSIMHTKLIADPISTWSSPEPKMKASGTTTWRFTKCDITPVDVDTWKVENGIMKVCSLLLELCRVASSVKLPITVGLF